MAIDFMLLALIILLLIFVIWISAALFGAPFQPSSDRALKRMIDLSNAKNTKKKIKIADLGSGNGKIIIAFAKLNPKIEAHGFEINPLLTWITKIRINSLGLKNRVFIHNKNYWKQDFSEFDIITSFQISYAMPGLISNTWKFPNWKSKKRIKDVYLYVK